MSGALEIDHKKMYDIKSAAELVGYSRDHVAALARAGKIVAAQVERHWYIDLDSLKQYSKITALEQEVKQKHLSEERRSTREVTETLTKRRHRKATHAAAHRKKMHANLAGFLVVLGLTAGVLAQIAPGLLAPADAQLASTKVSSGVIADQDGDFTVFDETIEFSDGAVSVSTMAESEEAILILPRGVDDPAAVFSDEVRIRRENGSTTLELIDSGRVVPLGVVMVPVFENKNP